MPEAVVGARSCDSRVISPYAIDCVHIRTPYALHAVLVEDRRDEGLAPLIARPDVVDPNYLYTHCPRNRHLKKVI